MRAVTAGVDRGPGTEGGALHRKRRESGCGATRNVGNPIFECVVPHADRKLGPIVHIAAAVGHHTNPTYELFAVGFTHKPGQDYVSFATMVQRRYIAIVQCAAIAMSSM